MKLRIGVIDVPYTSSGLPGVGKGGETTGDVAEILEAKYHVMETLYNLNEGAITDALRDGLEGTLESLLMGAPPTQNPFGSAESKIDDILKAGLSAQQLDGTIPGVATQAAKDGVSHRFKRPYVKRPPRPSFIDTGLYQTSIKTEVS